MRLQHWLAALVGIALFISSAPVLQAQAPPPGYAAGPPVMAPPGVHHAVGMPGTPPPQFGPWPAVSPYENMFQQTAFQDGLWMQETSLDQREYFLTLDALISKIRRPNRTLVGSEDVNPGPASSAAAGGVGISTTAFGRVTLGAFDDEFVGSPAFDGFHTDGRREIESSPGVRGRVGYLMPDGSGLELNAFWQSEGTWLWKRGVAAYLGGPETARATAGLVLNDNTAIGDYVKYDQMFRIFMDSESLGTGINFIHSKKYGGDSFQIKPTWGLRYLFIRERFSFHGADSGFTMSFNTNGAPDLSTLQPGVAPYFADLSSGVRSHLAGPQVGMLFLLGGDKLKFTGSTKVGLLANHEKLTLYGRGVGDGFDPNFNQDAEFSLKEDHTHVSPLVEAGINMEARVIEYIPFLRRVKQLEEAKLRIGYSITAAWEVARPGDIIRWQGQPNFPHLRVERTEWYVHGWNFGFDWRY